VNIVIGSAFRNCARNAPAYFERVRAFADLVPQHRVSVNAVEGDSIDNTRQALCIAAEMNHIHLNLVTCNHGGPEFGSTEQPERMVALSKVGNAIFESVKESDDALFYVESDLMWSPETARRLVNIATNMTGFDVISPLVLCGHTAPTFYDIWGFRGLDERRFSPFNPFYPGLEPGSETIFEVGSVGSCLAMRAHVARACRIRNDYCLVGWCEDARSQGYRIGVQPNLLVRQI